MSRPGLLSTSTRHRAPSTAGAAVRGRSTNSSGNAICKPMATMITASADQRCSPRAGRNQAGKIGSPRGSVPAEASTARARRVRPAERGRDGGLKTRQTHSFRHHRLKPPTSEGLSRTSRSLTAHCAFAARSRGLPSTRRARPDGWASSSRPGCRDAHDYGLSHMGLDKHAAKMRHTFMLRDDDAAAPQPAADHSLGRRLPAAWVSANGGQHAQAQ